MNETEQRSDDDLVAAAGHIGEEWIEAAELARLLSLVTGARSSAEQGLVDGFFLHERCLINFLCGDLSGRWRGSDMSPADFLGSGWVLGDEQLDCRLRGRLPTINKFMAHLTWERVTDESAMSWHIAFLAHEIHFALGLFVDAVVAAETAGAEHLAGCRARAEDLLPPLSRQPQTAVVPGPPRA